jgi:uncharacterized membrane protein YjjB (DUF3815 family)
MLLRSLYALIGSLGFSILFNVKGKDIIFGALGGGIAWLSYEMINTQGISTSTSLFIATAIVSAYAEIMARLRKQPVTIFVISSIIPLVPGSGMYYTTYESVKGNFSQSLTIGIETLFNAGAIAVAIVLVSSISKIIINRKKYKKKAKNTEVGSLKQ